VDYSWCKPQNNWDSIEWTGEWTHSQCPKDLWFNPDHSAEHGGVCDKWENLSEELREKYKSDPACNAHCYYEAKSDCGAEYIYRDFSDEGVLVDHHLSCPSDLVWSNDVRTCVRKCDLEACGVESCN